MGASVGNMAFFTLSSTKWDSVSDNLSALPNARRVRCSMLASSSSIVRLRGASKHHQRPDQLNTGHVQRTVLDNSRGRDNQMHDEFTSRVMRTPPALRRTSVSLTEAAADSPMLARLGALVERSKQHMVAIEPILPKGLKSQVTAGPVEEGVWCLLVRSGAVASKLRQLLPDLEARLLAVQGSNIKIRVKILAA